MHYMECIRIGYVECICLGYAVFWFCYIYVHVAYVVYHMLYFIANDESVCSLCVPY